MRAGSGESVGVLWWDEWKIFSCIDVAVHLALGRPTLAEGNRGPSPIWRLRTAKELDNTVRRVAHERDMTVSSFIREAVVTHIHPTH